MHLPPTAFESFFNHHIHPALLLQTDAPHHAILAVSDTFLQMTGQRREDVLGRGFFDVYGINGRSKELLRLRTAIDLLLATGKPFATPAYHYDYIRDDGSKATRYWNLDTRLMPLGNDENAICHTAMDVTDQVLVQQMQTHLLEHSEQDKMRVAGERQVLRELVDSNKVGAFILIPVRDEKGALTDFRFKSMTASLRENMERRVGLNIQFLSEVTQVYPDRNAFEKYRETLQTGNINSFDYCAAIEGPEQWFHITANRVNGGELLVTVMEQTEMKKIQLRLEQSVEELRRANGNLEEFAYAASHDLQEPLRKIQTFANMLHARCEGTLDAQSVALLARMQSATVRMRTLIEDLLQYSRLSLSNEAFGAVPLADVMQQALSNMADEIRFCGADISFEGLGNVQGSQAQLLLLIKHLLDNALKFAQEARPLVVKILGRLSYGEVAELENKSGELKYLRVDFEDNGIGFDPQYSERIFQIFQRLHGRSETAGTGVGLSMVQKIILNHKGAIRADGKPGEGATFTFWLPLAETPESA